MTPPLVLLFSPRATNTTGENIRMTDIGNSAGRAEQYDVSQGDGSNLLHSKAVGLIGVLFLTVTGAAPISAMLGNVPFGAGAGLGLYMPAAFLVATIVLTIFSVGYAAMATKVSSVGGFYSFISHGLGREVGLAAGISSAAAYSIFEASLYGLFAFFGAAKLKELTGTDVPWPYLAGFCVVLAAILSYFDVKISSWILGIALIGEVLILLIFDIATLTTTSLTTNFDPSALYPQNVLTGFAAHTTKGGVDLTAGFAAVGIFMAFWSWVGFEMAPNYAEESKEPKRIIPISLYFSVIALGLFYTFTSFCAVAAYPSADEMLVAAQKDAGNFFLNPMEKYGGVFFRDVMSYLILTSSFACGLAFHNTASRYFYSLGREGVLPSFLGFTQSRSKSPYAASFFQSFLAAIWVGLFAFFYGTNDPNAQAYVGLYTLLAILGTMLVLILQRRDTSPRG